MFGEWLDGAGGRRKIVYEFFPRKIYTPVNLEDEEAKYDLNPTTVVVVQDAEEENKPGALLDNDNDTQMDTQVGFYF